MSGPKCRRAHIDACPSKSDAIKYAPGTACSAHLFACSALLASLTRYAVLIHLLALLTHSLLKANDQMPQNQVALNHCAAAVIGSCSDLFGAFGFSQRRRVERSVLWTERG